MKPDQSLQKSTSPPVPPIYRVYLPLLISIIFLVGINFIRPLMSNDSLQFLLYPTQKLVGFFMGLNFEYTSETGYLCSSMPIAIEKSCSGINYFNVVSVVGIICLFNYLKKTSVIKLLALLPAVVALGYVFTVLINAVRIIIGIKLQAFAFGHSWFPNHFMHELVGVFYLLVFVILYFMLTRKALLKLQ